MLDVWALYFAKTLAVEVPLVALLVGNREPRKKRTCDPRAEGGATNGAKAGYEALPAFWPPHVSPRWRLRAVVVAFLANLVSHPLLTAALWYWVPAEPGTLAELQTFFALEGGVVGLEALIFWLVLPLRLWHAVALSLFINGITAAMSPLVWESWPWMIH